MHIESNSQRITQKSKDSNDKQYYKEHLDNLDRQGFARVSAVGNISETKKMQVNYDLFNNILNLEDLAYVCSPFGADAGQLPATMANRDIISGKIKAILGMEMKRPFAFASLAVNPEATTRKEQQEFGMIKDFVIGEIMKPIQEQAELKYQEQLKGKLTPEQVQEIKEQVAQEVESKTPPQVKKYMSREHQDPAEALNNQLLRYLIQDQNIKDKFNLCFKHGLIAGRQVMQIGLSNNNPFARVVNSKYFDYAKTNDQDKIEDAEWAQAMYSMSPSQIKSQFRTELKPEDIVNIDSFYKEGGTAGAYGDESLQTDAMFDFSSEGGVGHDHNAIRVLYGAWKGERKVGFLTYIDENKQVQEKLVSENYKLNREIGDLAIEWQWIPETHHGYKIMLSNPIYIGMGAVPGQHGDLDNLDKCVLPFVGVDYDDLNSEVTSAIDRIKGYQYLYNIIIYRIELLMASDKGKIFMMNLGAVPTSSGIDLKKFQYFFEANKIAYFNPNEEANKKGLQDINAIGKVFDMSLGSEIQQYINMAEYIEKKAGDGIGVPKQMEAQISADESVRNVQQVVTASSNILEPYYQRHNTFKRNVLQALTDVAKVGFAQGKPRKLAYFLDDMSQALINLDQNAMNLLSDSTLGIFIMDSTNANETRETIKNLAHAAMQTQQMDMLDVVKVMKTQDMQEAEEALEVGVNKKADLVHNQQMQIEQQKAKQEEAARAHEKEQWQHEADMIILKEGERRKTEIRKQTILSMGFNEDKDLDKDGEPDVLEVAKFGVEANIKNRELSLKERTQTENNAIAKEKLEVDKEKNSILKQKASSTK